MPEPPPRPDPRPEIRPVGDYFPGRTARWINDACRSGRIPGALKIGRTWMIATAAIVALSLGQPYVPTNEKPVSAVPSIEDAMADLRARGVL